MAGASKEIYNDILKGVYDEDLHKMQEVINTRRKMLRRVAIANNMVSIDIGDTVVIRNIRPKYMNGERGVVVEKKQTKLVLSVRPAGRFSGGNIIVPASCVELVETGSEGE